MEGHEKKIFELEEALLKANQDVEKLAKIKYDFVSILSHELRTPLASIKESVSLLLEEVTGSLNESQKEFLSIAKNNIDKLVRVMTDILDFSKIESGSVSIRRKKADINELIISAHSSYRAIVEKKNIGFDLELSQGIGKIWFDPEKISQVLKNLVSNAIKFNKDNGKIKILTCRENKDGKESVKVTVEDTGIGISKEGTSSLFRHFSPLDTSLTRKYTGVGLGLAICKGIIELHGGDIWVESDEGIGSRFIFTLPVYSKDNEFHLMLDETIERVKYSGLKLSLIIFRADDEKLAELEKDIGSLVRGPSDIVTRFKDGCDSIVLIAVTDRMGAMRIIERIKGKIKVPVRFGITVYPDEAANKDDLVKKTKEDMANNKNMIV